MWRRHQALLQSRVQRQLYGHHRTSVGIIGTIHLLSSSSIRSIHGGVASSYTSNLLSPQSWPSVVLSARRDVSHPSLKQPALISCHALSTSRGKGNNGPRRGPDFRNYDSVEEIIEAAYHNLDVMSRRDVSAFWTCILKLMTRRDNQKRRLSKSPAEDMWIVIKTIFDNTADGIKDCNMKELTQTTLGMAKIVQILRKRAGGRRGEDAYRIVLRELLLNKDNRTANTDLFHFFAEQSMAILHEFNARGLSNLAYSYALIEYVPKFDDGSDLFDHIAMQSIKMRAEFNAQDVSNMVWAFATVDKRHDALFKAIGDHIVELKSLDRFTHPQDVSNTVWAYATAGVSHPQLFEKMANHIVGLDNLHRLDPQALSNTVWAYAKARVSHPGLLEKIGNHIVGLKSLDRFTHPQDVSNIVWAYATAQVFHPKMFQQVTKAAIQRKDDFISQHVANILWSYATMGIVDKHLFSSFVPTAAKLMGNYNNQGFLGNIAWAYAVADVDAPTLFNDRFINMCLEKEDGFSLKDLTQLHQWHLWQTKEKSRTGLPEELQDRCYKAFISEEPRPSKFQDDVVDQLSSIGLKPKEEILMDSGYRIDAIVEVNEKTKGVEVDGPSHFTGRSKSPLGSTIMKRRQVPSIDGIELVSVPYWEWDNLGKSQAKKQDYLRQLLNL